MPGSGRLRKRHLTATGLRKAKRGATWEQETGWTTRRGARKVSERKPVSGAKRRRTQPGMPGPEPRGDDCGYCGSANENSAVPAATEMYCRPSTA